MTLLEVFQSLPASNEKDIKGSIIVQKACELPVKFVFVRNRSQKREWEDYFSTLPMNSAIWKTSLRFSSS
ncbi:hypothetical protein HQN87_07465 [Paenibacillus tritici]|uniref:Uncharacterized protein n=1 Tax=Paenibacillus tritici TaxID=1873425 RepID=A0ABX2DMU8_9BACL|nr:hypothetical protein [Paenibacillus tritici]